MSKVLDLNAFKEETLDIKMLDGKTYSIAKPTEKMVITMLALKDDSLSNDPERMLKAVNGTVEAILKTNTNGYAIDEMVSSLSLKMKTAIIKAYSDYISGIQSDPN